MTDTIRFPATYVRGGTSRAILFREVDLPSDKRSWSRIFAAALGSPDASGRQLDGLGGGITSLSKVAVVSPSAQPDCDVDYAFFQVDPRSGSVQTLVTCGNIVSSIGPFAVSNGWVVAATEGMTTVRIFDVNSKKRVDARFAATDDESELISIDGVPGQAPAIGLTFRDPGGSVCDGLFPTSHKTETLEVDALGEIKVTLIDATLPTVIAEAASFGLRGDESPAELSTPHLLAQMESLRIAGGLRMGVTDSKAALQSDLFNVPDVVLISPAAPGAIQARFFSGGGAHRAAPVTSSIALACACQIEGTLAADMTPGKGEVTSTWQILNPAGVLSVRVSGSSPGAEDRRMAGIESASVLRTTRVVMEGDVVLERRLLR